jgi:hypothetical protein
MDFTDSILTPRGLLARIILVLLQPSIVDHRRHLAGFDLGQRLRSYAQVGPAGLYFGERFSVPPLGLNGVAGLQTPLLLALANKRAKVFRYALSEPVDAAVRMFPWTRHCKGHCTSLLYQPGSLKPLILLIDFCHRYLTVAWCPGAGSNHRHCDFQSHALPTELPGQVPARAAGAPVYSQARRSCPPRFAFGYAWRSHTEPQAKRARRSPPGRRRAAAQKGR